MNNIFTFEIDEDEQEYQSNHQKLKKIQENKEEKNKGIIPQLFTFDDFEDEESGYSEKGKKNLDENERKPFGQLSRRKVNMRKNKFPTQSQHEKSQNFQQSESKDLKKQKKQKCSQILAGLEVQDLGVKQMQYVSQKKALKVTDMRKFLHTPLGDYKIKGLIRKQGGNLLNFNNKFNVYIEQNNRYLFTISREGISEYVFSMDKNNTSQKKKSYLGKMIANMAGTEFLLFDNGFSPKQTRSLEACRKQFASIKYDASSGPRKFTTIVSTNCQGFYALEPDQNILQHKWQKKQRDYLSILYSKAPQLDPEDGNYKLDFKGIVKKASVKNFILGGVQWDDSLIFGKIDNNTFVMQIKQPLCVFQAAAICISSIHYKLHWR